MKHPRPCEELTVGDALPDPRLDGLEAGRLLAGLDQPSDGTVIVDGREIDGMALGVSPRRAATTLYLAGGLDEYADLLADLGRHTTGKDCLYVKRLDDLDRGDFAASKRGGERGRTWRRPRARRPPR